MSLLTDLASTIHKKEAELRALKTAYDVLQSNFPDDSMPAEPSVAPPSAPLQSEIPERTAEPAPSPPKPVYTGPRCGACGAKMFQTARTMPSGAMVSLWKCNDSGCGNEVYQ